MMNVPELDRAFKAARYRVACAHTWHTLAIDTPCPAALGAWLGARGARAAWLVTACNPGARVLERHINQARTAVLRDWVDRHKLAVLDSVNVDPNGDWPDEPGLLIGGLEEGLARAVARRFGQVAVVAVRRNAPVSLVWLSSPPGGIFDPAASRHTDGR